MKGRAKSRRLTIGWRKILLGVGCTSVAVAGIWLARGLPGRATGQVADDPTRMARVVSGPSAETTYPYSSALVATIGDGKQGITREELGEYLIARYGEKVEHLINHRIIEDACKARGIEVTQKEVDQKLAEDLKDLNIDRLRFVKEFLRARGKTLYEWKEDHLRPELLMVKLCREQLSVTDQDIRNAYESRYGEMIECRAIEFRKEKKAEAEALYPQLASDENAFAEAARKQTNTSLAVNGGRLKAFGRHTLDNEEMEAKAFQLQPGQVTPLIKIKETEGYVVLKCDQRIPANTSVPYEKVKDELAKEVLEHKAQTRFQDKFAELKKQADVQLLLVRKPSDEEQPEEQPYGYVRDAQAGASKERVVATLYGGTVKLTREDLGEFLIKRYGAANLELLVNRRIIENACQTGGITVTAAEVDAEFLLDCAKYEQERKKTHPDEPILQNPPSLADPNMDSMKKHFILERLAPNKTSVFQYKEDIVRPRILLGRLCRDKVQVTSQDVDAAIEAYYGEKVECRMILWPNSPENTKFVLQDYEQIRDNPRVFDDKARTQACQRLANNEGRLDRPVGHHTTGNDELERAAFSLREGEVSQVIGTPEGLVVLKCVGRIPAQQVDRDKVRDERMAEIVEKKTQAAMPAVFLELKTMAHPRYLIDDPNRMFDLKDEASRDLQAQPPHQQ